VSLTNENCLSTSLQPNGSSVSRPVTISNKTADPISPPFTADDVADFIGLPLPLSDADTAIIEALSKAAVQQYIDRTGREMLARDYTWKASRHPERVPSYGGLGASPAALSWWIELPVSPVSAIASVTVDDVVTTGYQFEPDHIPARLVMDSYTGGAIVIEYTAGYATAAEVPDSARLGAMMLAAYLYDHRGACSVDDAVNNSGAGALWATDMVIRNL